MIIVSFTRELVGVLLQLKNKLKLIRNNTIKKIFFKNSAVKIT